MTPIWTWQRVGDDEWEFGEVVRGMIRDVKGCVYFDEDRDAAEGGWVWMVLLPGQQGPRGLAINRREAARRVEEAMNIR
jgi:hypothetical protein